MRTGNALRGNLEENWLAASEVLSMLVIGKQVVKDGIRRLPLPRERVLLAA